MFIYADRKKLCLRGSGAERTKQIFRVIESQWELECQPERAKESQLEPDRECRREGQLES